MTTETHDAAAFIAERVSPEIALVRFKRHILFHAAQLTDKNELLTYMQDLAYDPQVRCLILVGNPGKRGTPEFEEWYTYLRSPGHEPHTLTRTTYAFQQIIRAIVTIPQLVLYAEAGTLTFNYLSLALAADAVVFGADTRIQNPNAHRDLLPAGGAAWFLGKRLGHRQALALLASEQDLSAEEAKNLGLCDAVVPSEAVQPWAVNQARVWAERDGAYLHSLKRALHSDLAQLDAWFDRETKEITRNFRLIW